jgi:hypothetical protein
LRGPWTACVVHSMADSRFLQPSSTGPAINLWTCLWDLSWRSRSSTICNCLNLAELILVSCSCHLVLIPNSSTVGGCSVDEINVLQSSQVVAGGWAAAVAAAGWLRCTLWWLPASSISFYPFIYYNL